MGKSPCWSYVRWYNRRSSGNWVTWEPGDLVSSGDVGRFDENLRFLHYQTLHDFGIDFEASEETPVQARMYATGKKFKIQSKMAGELPGIADADIKATAKKEHACLLQIREATETHLLRIRPILDAIAACMREGTFDLDLNVVNGRIRAAHGFAAIAQDAGQTIELTATGKVGLADDLGLGGAELSLATGGASGEFLVYEFDTIATPIFTPPIRVRQSLLNRLLPWRSDGPFLIDPTGKAHDVHNMPTDLSYLSPEDRRYDPTRSAMSPAELAAIPVESLFEEVRKLPGPGTPTPGGKGGPVPGADYLVATGTPAFDLPLPMPTQQIVQMQQVYTDPT
jgi:hypothetical protein